MKKKINFGYKLRRNSLKEKTLFMKSMKNKWALLDFIN